MCARLTLDTSLPTHKRQGEVDRVETLSGDSCCLMAVRAVFESHTRQTESQPGNYTFEHRIPLDYISYTSLRLHVGHNLNREAMPSRAKTNAKESCLELTST